MILILFVDQASLRRSLVYCTHSMDKDNDSDLNQELLRRYIHVRQFERLMEAFLAMHMR